MSIDIDHQKRIRRYENGQDKFNFQEETRKANPFLENFGRDRLSYKPETPLLANQFWR